MTNSRLIKSTGVKCRNCGIHFIVAGVGTTAAQERCCSRACLENVGPWMPIHGPQPMPRGYDDPRLHRRGVVADEGVAHKPNKKRNKKKKARARWDAADPFYLTRDWQELRYAALTKYGRCCMKCGKTSGPMQVDHIKPRSKFRHLQLAFDNLQILCKDCNLGKGNKDCIDYRPASALPFIPANVLTKLCDCCKEKFIPKKNVA